MHLSPRSYIGQASSYTSESNASGSCKS